MEGFQAQGKGNAGEDFSTTHSDQGGDTIRKLSQQTDNLLAIICLLQNQFEAVKRDVQGIKENVAKLGPRDDARERRKSKKQVLPHVLRPEVCSSTTDPTDPPLTEKDPELGAVWPRLEPKQEMSQQYGQVEESDTSRRFHFSANVPFFGASSDQVEGTSYLGAEASPSMQQKWEESQNGRKVKTSSESENMMQLAIKPEQASVHSNSASTVHSNSASSECKTENVFDELVNLKNEFQEWRVASSLIPAQLRLEMRHLASAQKEQEQKIDDLRRFLNLQTHSSIVQQKLLLEEMKSLSQKQTSFSVDLSGMEEKIRANQGWNDYEELLDGMCQQNEDICEIMTYVGKQIKELKVSVKEQSSWSWRCDTCMATNTLKEGSSQKLISTSAGALILGPPVLVGERNGEDQLYDPHDDPKISLLESLDLTTGDDGEEVIFKARGKLFCYDSNIKAWQDGCVGEVKILKNLETGRARLLMKTEKIHKICANHWLKPDMQLLPMSSSDCAFVWNAIDFAKGEKFHERFSLEFKTPDLAAEFKKIFDKMKRWREKSSERAEPIKAREPVLLKDKSSGHSVNSTNSYGLRKKVGCVKEEDDFDDVVDDSDDDSDENHPQRQEKSSLADSAEISTAKSSSHLIKSPTPPSQSSASHMSSTKPMVTQTSQSLTHLQSLASCLTPVTSSSFALSQTCQIPKSTAPETTTTASSPFAGFSFQTTPSKKDTPLLFGSKILSPQLASTKPTVTTQSLPYSQSLTSHLASTKTTVTTQSPFAGFSFNKTPVTSSSFAPSQTFQIPKSTAPETTTTASSPFAGFSFQTTLSKKDTPLLFGSNASSQSSKDNNAAQQYAQLAALLAGGPNEEDEGTAESPRPGFYAPSQSSETSQRKPGQSPVGVTSSASQKKDKSSTSPLKGKDDNCDNDDVIFLDEVKATPEQVAKAEKLMLSPNFYLYEQRPPCPGCRGCDEEDWKAKTEGKKPIVVEQQSSSLFPEKPKVSEQATQPPTFFGNTAISSLSFAALPAVGDASLAKKDTSTKPFQFAGTDARVFGSTQRDDDNVAEDQEYDPHFDPIVSLPENVDLTTGDEGQEVVFKERAKLYRYDSDTQALKERGVGDMKILLSPETGKARIMMRREQVLNEVIGPSPQRLSSEVRDLNRSQHQQEAKNDELKKTQREIHAKSLNQNKQLSNNIKKLTERVLALEAEQREADNIRMNEMSGQISGLEERSTDTENKFQELEIVLEDQNQKNLECVQGLLAQVEDLKTRNREHEIRYELLKLNQAKLQEALIKTSNELLRRQIVAQKEQEKYNRELQESLNELILQNQREWEKLRSDLTQMEQSVNQLDELSTEMRTRIKGLEDINEQNEETLRSYQENLEQSVQELKSNLEKQEDEVEESLKDLEEKIEAVRMEKVEQAAPAGPPVGPPQSPQQRPQGAVIDPTPYQQQTRHPHAVTYVPLVPMQDTYILGMHEGRGTPTEEAKMHEQQIIMGGPGLQPGGDAGGYATGLEPVPSNQVSQTANVPQPVTRMRGMRAAPLQYPSPPSGQFISVPQQPGFSPQNIRQRMEAAPSPTAYPAVAAQRQQSSVMANQPGIHLPTVPSTIGPALSTATPATQGYPMRPSTLASQSPTHQQVPLPRAAQSPFAGSSSKATPSGGISYPTSQVPGQSLSTSSTPQPGEDTTVPKGLTPSKPSVSQQDPDLLNLPVRRPGENFISATPQIHEGGDLTPGLHAQMQSSFGDPATSKLNFAGIAAAGDAGSIRGGPSKPFSQFPGAGTQLFESSSTPQQEEESVTEDEEYDPHLIPIVSLQENVDLITGDEGQEVVFKERAKLYRYDNDTQEWKKRGVGDMKILKDPETGKARILMRREQVLKVCANHWLKPDMRLLPLSSSKHAFVWNVIDFAEGEECHEKFVVKFKTPELAAKFKETFDQMKKGAGPSFAKPIEPAKEEPAETLQDTQALSTEEVSDHHTQQTDPLEAWGELRSQEEEEAETKEEKMEEKEDAEPKDEDGGYEEDQQQLSSGEAEEEGTEDSGISKQQPSFSEMFKPASGSWDCDSCMINNPADKVQCLACSTPKPGSSQPSQGTSGDSQGAPGGMGMSGGAFSLGNFKFSGFSSNPSAFSAGSGFGSSGSNKSTPGTFSFGQTPSQSSNTTPSSSAGFRLPPGGFSFTQPKPETSQPSDSGGFKIPAASFFSFTAPTPPSSESTKSTADSTTKEQPLSKPTEAAPGQQTITTPKFNFGSGMPQFSFGGTNQQKPRSGFSCGSTPGSSALTSQAAGTPSSSTATQPGHVFGGMQATPIFSATPEKGSTSAFKGFEFGTKQSEQKTEQKEAISLSPGPFSFGRTPSQSSNTTFSNSAGFSLYPGGFSFTQPKPETSQQSDSGGFKMPAASSFSFTASTPPSSESTKSTADSTTKEQPLSKPTEVAPGQQTITTPKFNFGSGMPQFSFGGTNQQKPSSGFSCGSTPGSSALTSQTAGTPSSSTPTQPGSLFGQTQATPIFGATPEKGSTSAFKGFEFGTKQSEPKTEQKEAISFSDLVKNQGGFSFLLNFDNVASSAPKSGAKSPVKSPGLNKCGQFYQEEERDDLYFEPVVTLPENYKLETGEENEQVKFSQRAKLYRFDVEGSQWKERGVGDIKVLYNPETMKHRIVMRRDQVLKVCANHYITQHVNLQPNKGSDRSWVWQAMDSSDGDPQNEQLAARFKTEDAAREFKEVVDEAKENIPGTLDQPVQPVGKAETKKAAHTPSSSTPTQPGSLFGQTQATPIFGATPEKGSMSAFKGFEFDTKQSEPKTEQKEAISFSDLVKNQGEFSFRLNVDNVASSPPKSGAKSPVKSPGLNKSGGCYQEEERDDLYFEPVVTLPENYKLETGEENEEVKFSQRAKLYRFDVEGSQWKERGVGDIKVLYNPETKQHRIVMRRDQVLKVCANHHITQHVNLQPNKGSDRSWVWRAMDSSDGDPQNEQLAVRFKTEDAAREFKEVVEDAKKNIPGTLDQPVGPAGKAETKKNLVPAVSDKTETGDVAKDKLEVEDVARDKLETGYVARDKLEFGDVTRDKLEAVDVATVKLDIGDVARDELETGHVARDKLEVGDVTRDKLEAGDVVMDLLSGRRC